MELIVLVDDDGTAIGTMPKPQVHHGETPLHRAFSAYLFDDAGRLLITRRAEDKATFRERQENEGDAWSPWCREQARLIEVAGLVPGG